MADVRLRLVLQTHDEASCLGVQTLLYFGSDNAKLLRHLQRFKYETDDFNHLDLVAELEVARNVPLAPLFIRTG